jgi:methyl-accepting chemotaxis protein
MILYIFSSIAVIFFLIFLYNYNISRRIVRKNLITNAENLTSLTVSKVENVLNSVMKIPQNFAGIIESSDHSKEELINLLYQMVKNNPEIYGAAMAFEPYYYDSLQKYYSPYFYRDSSEVIFKYIGDEKYNYFMMDWYQIPKELNRAMWSEPYYDEGAGNTIMSTYSVPMYKNQNGQRKFIGILTSDISLDWLQEYMNSIKIYETGYGYMISSNGTIVTHPDKEMIMNETIFSIADIQKSPKLRQIGKNMINGEVSFAEFEYRNVHTGKLSWLAYAPVTLNNWSVGIVFPVDEFMADVNNLAIRLFVFCLLGLLILLILIILISRSITRPLRILTAAAGKFAEGDFNITLPEIKSSDEIGTLNDSFIYMQKELASTISDLKETSSQLKLSNEMLEEYSRTLEQKVKERTAELFDKNKKLDTAFSNVKILNEIGKKLTSTLNISLIQDIVYENVNSLMDATTLLIMIYNEKERKLECKLSIEKGEKLPPFEISMDEKDRFAVWCVDNASPVFMNDVDSEYIRYIPYRPAPKAGERVSSLMYLPMMIENRIIGIISVQSFKKDAYSQYQLDMLNNLANYIAIALENALSYEKINKANSDLKAAQAQLVQSEKMASLGQLTAGIAHEIKNPLNFINNFSDLTAELAAELNEEFNKLAGSISPDEREYLQQINDDISSNAKKISEHGKRADRIIRGM